MERAVEMKPLRTSKTIHRLWFPSVWAKIGIFDSPKIIKNAPMN